MTKSCSGVMLVRLRSTRLFHISPTFHPKPQSSIYSKPSTAFGIFHLEKKKKRPFYGKKFYKQKTSVAILVAVTWGSPRGFDLCFPGSRQYRMSSVCLWSLVSLVSGRDVSAYSLVSVATQAFIPSTQEGFELSVEPCHSFSYDHNISLQCL